ncbi:MAG: hypothetical protein WDN69_18625 [Aliidongia sp.]
MRDGTITPEQLDRALAGGCADAPTVVIVSGCATGDWAAPPMARPNRLILTAAAGERTGLRLRPQCRLHDLRRGLRRRHPGRARLGLDSSPGRGIACCGRESLVQQPSVDPQIYIGPLVARLPAPWQNRPGPEGIARQVNWRQGIGRFSIDRHAVFLDAAAA